MNCRQGLTRGVSALAAAVLLLLPGLAVAQRVDYKITVPMDVSGLDPRAGSVDVSCEPDGVDTYMGERYRVHADLDASGSFRGKLVFMQELPNPNDAVNLTTYRCHWFICDQPGAMGRCDYPEPGGTGFNGVSADPSPVLWFRASFH